MANHNAKRKRGRILRLLVIISIMVYFGIVFVTQQADIKIANEKKQELTNQLELLEHEAELLSRRQDHLGSDSDLENRARDKLGWVKDDEIVFYEKEDLSSEVTEPAD